MRMARKMSSASTSRSMPSLFGAIWPRRTVMMFVTSSGRSTVSIAENRIGWSPRRNCV